MPSPDNQWIIALTSALVAMAALFIVTWQTVSIHRHNRLSVKPVLGLGLHFFPEKEITVFLANDGIGPAFVDYISLDVNGTPYDGTISEQFRACFSQLGLSARYVFHVPTVAHGAMTPGEKLALLRFPETEANMELRTHVRDKLSLITITVHYRSIYNEAFVTRRTLKLA